MWVATTAVWIFLSALVERVRKVVTPIFSPGGIAENGSVGTKLFSRNIRVLYVNGVGNSLAKCHETTSSISRIFNNSRINYTYIPLRYDQVIRTIMSNHRPGGCSLLIDHIRELLEELGRTERNASLTRSELPVCHHHPLGREGRLLIFAHSGGGAMVEAIREELTPEERSRIHVYSFGSAHLFSSAEGFEKVSNAVARGDPVPGICRRVDRRFKPLGEEWWIGTPAVLNISNHSIINDVYQHAMWQIREKYLPAQ
jgi:hypothetical protein